MENYFGINYKEIFESGYYESNKFNHSMGESLPEYINIKIPEFVLEQKYKKIYIIGNYDRTSGISYKEKNDKIFNFKRPTFVIQNDSIYVYCYPGMDYVYHYASLIKTYLGLLKIKKDVIVEFPSIEKIKNEIDRSNLKFVPKKNIAILGYVEGLEYLSSDPCWNGNGDFLWKNIDDYKILIGCKHSYWGDISGYVVSCLAEMGYEMVIYVGKLGTLNGSYKPNEIVATGDTSMFFDGTMIEWDNLFDENYDVRIRSGVHYTLPSVIQETNDLVCSIEKYIDYIDPEIGHMANAANRNNIQFSYLHIVSDNLSKKYDEDLSNERKEETLVKRKKLLKVIGSLIMKL